MLGAATAASADLNAILKADDAQKDNNVFLTSDHGQEPEPRLSSISPSVIRSPLHLAQVVIRFDGVRRRQGRAMLRASQTTAGLSAHRNCSPLPPASGAAL